MASQISFASFNLQNFQAPKQNVYQKPVSQPFYDKKLAWTESMFAQIDADIIAFQELWNKQCLYDVLKNHPDYTPVFIGDEWYNIAVALAVREPWVVKKSEVIKAFPFEQLVKVDDNDGEDDEFSLQIKQFSRSILKVELENKHSTTTPDITVFACHLKSKLPSQTQGFASQYQTAIGSAMSTVRRTAEAAALRMMLIDHMRHNDQPTVVIGDFNDDPQSNTLSIVTDQPTMTAASRGVDSGLYSALYLQQLQSFRNVYYTYDHQHHRDVLDHILVSKEFFNYAKDSIWGLKEARVWNDHIDDGLDYSTDHGIIKATFK